jgi:hypothetical protein
VLSDQYDLLPPMGLLLGLDAGFFVLDVFFGRSRVAVARHVIAEAFGQDSAGVHHWLLILPSRRSWWQAWCDAPQPECGLPTAQLGECRWASTVFLAGRSPAVAARLHGGDKPIPPGILRQRVAGDLDAERSYAGDRGHGGLSRRVPGTSRRPGPDRGQRTVLTVRQLRGYATGAGRPQARRLRMKVGSPGQTDQWNLLGQILAACSSTGR